MFRPYAIGRAGGMGETMFRPYAIGRSGGMGETMFRPYFFSWATIPMSCNRATSLIQSALPVSSFGHWSGWSGT